MLANERQQTTNVQKKGPKFYSFFFPITGVLISSNMLYVY